MERHSADIRGPRPHKLVLTRYGKISRMTGLVRCHLAGG
jgi:hypothetical protein